MQKLLWIQLQILTSAGMWAGFWATRSPWLFGGAVGATLSALHMAMKDAATYVKH